MENDEFTATASNMKNDVEKASASSNNDEDTNKANEKMVWNCDEGYHEINNEEWEIQKFWLELEGLKESPPLQDRAAGFCIYRVPNSLRVSNPEAYTPQLISIGLFHHNSERLKAMETLKRRYQGEFLKRTEMDENKFMDFVRRIQKEEVSIRRCYSENFRIQTERFVRMIVLDAVFIIEFLKESYAAGFPKNIDTRMRFCIVEDLMLLENQLPFSILDIIYSEFYHPSQDENKNPLLDLATRHFGNYYPLAQRAPESICATDKVQHFTDLLLKSMMEGALERENRSYPIKLKYNAAMLRKAGVKFQKTEDKCLFNVHFEKGVLKIPILTVDDSLERLVRNVMAWEQCSKPGEAYICNYFKFMDHLIDRAEDVALLVEEGIFINWLGDDDAVSKLMNNLSQRSETTSYYSDICQKMNEYYENPWNRRKATLKLVYFSNLWRGTGTLAAAFLLILTLIQTITSLKSCLVLLILHNN